MHLNDHNDCISHSNGYMNDNKAYTIKDCKTVELPTFTDDRGALTLVDRQTAEAQLPFIPRRAFWIHHTPHNATRGEHAHRTCWELVVAVSGMFHLTLTDGQTTKDFVLDTPNKGVLIPPMVWCRLWGFAPDTVCLTLASEDYDAEGYINDYKTFISAD